MVPSSLSSCQGADTLEQIMVFSLDFVPDQDLSPSQQHEEGGWPFLENVLKTSHTIREERETLVPDTGLSLVTDCHSRQSHSRRLLSLRI
jgi:hypothetical protein